MNYQISKELLQKLLDYLVLKPYVETYKLVEAIQNLKSVENKDEAGR